MVSDSFYHLDIYKKDGFLKKRVKIIFEGSEFYLPKKQMEKFNKMIELEPDKLSLLNNEAIFAVCLNDDLHFKISYKNDMLNFSIVREWSDFLFIIKIH